MDYPRGFYRRLPFGDRPGPGFRVGGGEKGQQAEQAVRSPDHAPEGRFADTQVGEEGFALFAKKDLDGAIAKYEAALEVDPTFVLAWSALGMAHSRKGEIDEAIAAGLKAVELEPDEALGYTNLSIFYQQKGMVPEAEDAKARAMQLSIRAQGGS